MKQLFTLMAVLLLAACAQSEEEKAQACLSAIDSLYAQGKYRETLDSVTSLRERFPKAIEARRHALKVWQDASLKMAQAEVAQTDILLQQTIAQIPSAGSLYQRNRLLVRRDSLQARYDAMCGVVRMIHLRQKQGVR